MKKFLSLARYLLAFTFIFSGFVKGVDPLGSAYKFHDYFLAFGLDFLQPLTLFFSVSLSALELLFGLLLLFNILPKIATWGILIFMLVFTPLTLALAIFNPVSDCGCFGDAIHLSNWHTFFKNLLFLLAALYLFRNRNRLRPSVTGSGQVVLSAIMMVFALVPSHIGYRHLPIFDFRPYHIGANIYQSMQYPHDAPPDEYKTLLYYEKDGKVKEFDETNYPWNDSTWTFVDSKSILIKKGYTPPITNFSLTDISGIDITDSIIRSPGYQLFIVSPWLDRVSDSAVDTLRQVISAAKQAGYLTFWATAASTGSALAMQNRLGIDSLMVLGDEVMLKTIVRANPGILLLHNGTIIGKWNWTDFPSSILSNDNPASLLISRIQARKELYLAMALSAVLFLLLAIYRLRINRGTR